MANIVDIIRDLLNTSQTNSEIVASAIIFSVIALIGFTAYTIFSKAFCAWTKNKSCGSLVNNVKKITIALVLLFGSYYTLTALPILEPFSAELTLIFQILGIVVGAFMITRLTNALADWYLKQHPSYTSNNNHLLFLFKKIIQFVVYSLAFLVILWVWGQDLSGIVVGLGVGGIAIAFALQNTLSDFFSAFSIYFDRPFEIGDFVVVGDHSGTVTNIGLKSTRIKLLQGEELVISNKELTSTRVRNFRKLERRRITFTIGVTYNTPLVKLKKIPDIIRGIFAQIELTELFRVHFTEFGEYSLKFQIIYYVNTPDHGVYLDTQQKINYAIKEAFEKEAIEIAFPTQTIFVEKSQS